VTNGRPPRDVVFLLAGAAVLYIAFWLAVRLRSLLVMLLISLFLAFALEPAANRLARRGWRRGWPPRPCEPTGRRLELRGVLIAEFEGDRIRRFRQYWNEVELLDGLGLLPA
jgi:hypothetical protein